MTLLSERQKLILEIVGERSVSGQSELIRLLNERGVSVTQATVSRDIHRLGLKKTRVKNPDGSFSARYTVEAQPVGEKATAFEALCRDALLSVDSAQNMIVLKTQSGMAQAVCAAFDAVGCEQAIGSLAGEDTIFIVCRTAEDARGVISMLDKATEG